MARSVSLRHLLPGLLVLNCAAGNPLIAESPPVPRGAAQLFVDDSLIAESHGLQRTLRQPLKDSGGTAPVLSIPPLEGRLTTLEANGSIVHDPRLGRWVMYCLAFAAGLKPDEPNGWQRVRLLRFTSVDGLSWQSDSPDGMEQVFPRTREDLHDPPNNAYATNVDACTIWFDQADAEWPYKAWFWLYNAEPGRGGAYYHRSRDGRVFERGERILQSKVRAIDHAGSEILGPGDMTRFAPDADGGRFLAIFKFKMRTGGGDPATGNELRSRAYLHVRRLDEPIDPRRIKYVQLVPENRQANGDFPFDEYYDSTAYRYGSLWLGDLRIWHGRGDYPWSRAGCAYLKLMSSTDGLNWRRVTFVNDSGIPEVFIANGEPEGGNGGRNDAGYITSFSSGPLLIGDELIFYYGASSFGKNAGDKLRISGGGIFRARLRLDGFVSVDAGRITTPPLRFDGDQLRVNSVGPVTVEALDESGRVLGLARLEGDEVRHPAAFDGRSLRAVAGPNKSVALRFTVQPGSALYSFVID